MFFAIFPAVCTGPISKNKTMSNAGKLRILPVQEYTSHFILLLKTVTQPLVARTEPHHSFTIGQSINLVPHLDKARYFDKDTELSILKELDDKAR